MRYANFHLQLARENLTCSKYFRTLWLGKKGH